MEASLSAVFKLVSCITRSGQVGEPPFSDNVVQLDSSVQLSMYDLTNMVESPLIKEAD
jgi:hypothetical protein